MICRFFEDGQKLNVADLNEITVLVDRSETALTEVALNQWPSQLKGPPHLHEKKEQMFFIVSGAGLVRVGDQTFEVKPNDLVYVPAAAKHQTIATSAEPLRYLLFNAFADSDKEGHASFAEHVEKVKNTRKEQALASPPAPAHPPPRPHRSPSRNTWGTFCHGFNRMQGTLRRPCCWTMPTLNAAVPCWSRHPPPAKSARTASTTGSRRSSFFPEPAGSPSVTKAGMPGEVTWHSFRETRPSPPKRPARG